jgi:hypothetical protein
MSAIENEVAEGRRKNISNEIGFGKVFEVRIFLAPFFAKLA